jgi:hypothetical protein
VQEYPEDVAVVVAAEEDTVMMEDQYVVVVVRLVVAAADTEEVVVAHSAEALVDAVVDAEEVLAGVDVPDQSVIAEHPLVESKLVDAVAVVVVVEAADDTEDPFRYDPTLVPVRVLGDASGEPREAFHEPFAMDLCDSSRVAYPNVFRPRAILAVPYFRIHFHLSWETSGRDVAK